MAFPGNRGRSGDEATQKTAVTHYADQGQCKSGDVALEICERGEVTKKTEYQAACADMKGRSRQQPREKSTEQYSTHCNHCELVFAARTNHSSQNYEG